MKEQEVIIFWQNGSKDSIATATILFNNKKYDHCLFFCHLAIEKILKAKIVKDTGKSPSPIHDLIKLAKKAKIVLNDSQIDQLAEISTFNVQARYDDYKLQFYKKATRKFTLKYLKETEKLLKWIRTNK